MMTSKLSLTIVLTFVLTAGSLHAQNKNNVQGDFEALQALYNATQGSGIEVLNSVTELPDPEDAAYPFMYIINDEIWFLEKIRSRGTGTWQNRGAIWKDKTGWDTMTPETMGDAVGVTTDSNGRVTILDMQKVTTEPYGSGFVTTGNGLIGTLPPEIGNLKKMQWINLKQNYFHGEIPDVFDGWNDLERWSVGGYNWEMNLDKRNDQHVSDHRKVNYDNDPFTHGVSGKAITSTNNFRTTLPATLNGLQNLELIEAAHQYLIGPLPDYNNLPSILGLYLADVRGSSGKRLQVPDSWGGLSNMQVFHIGTEHSKPKWDGTLPAAMKDWGNLSVFHLASNDFTGDFPQFTGFTDIRVFDIKYNEFTGEFPWTSIFNGNNSWINVFRIASNEFTGSLPQTIPSPTFPASRSAYGINDFGIHANKFSGNLPDWVSQLLGLQIINISYNNFTGSFPADLLNQGNLKTVFLQGNSLSGTLPEGTWDTDRIRWFRIDGNDFEGEIPEGWKSLFQENDLTTWNDGTYQRYRFENNNLSGRVPDWGKNVSWGRYQMYSFQNNKYTFKDILPVYDELKGYFGDKFKITNQKPFGEPVTRTMPEDSQLIIDLSDVHYEGNSYQWTKDGTPLTGVNSSVLELSGLTTEDEGVYRLEVTNSSLPELGNHVSEPITFEIGADDGLNENDGGDTDSKGDGSDGETGAVVFPESPMNLSPHNGAEGVTLTTELSWSSVEGADYYILHMSRTNPSGMVIDVMVEDTTYLHPEILGADARHHWRVKAVKTDEEGEWSDILEFRTVTADLPDVADLVSPANYNENTPLQPRLVWGNVAADSYQVRIFTESFFDPEYDEMSDTNFFTPEVALDPGTNYTWQVKSISGGTEGAWGPRWEFSTDAYSSTEDSVDVPYLVAPSNGTENNTLQPTFEWTNVDADHYVLTVHKTDTVQAKSNTLLQMQSSVIHAETSEPLFTPDAPLEPETDYYWKVQAVKAGVDGDWSEQWHFKTPAGEAVSVDPAELTKSTKLHQNYPNPFNPSTQIEFSIADVEKVSLNVYDMAGRRVAELVNGILQAGSHRVTFTAEHLASGIYFYRLITGSKVHTKKMTLVK